MSPSTKNLRERIEEILNQNQTPDEQGGYPSLSATAETLTELLSSELSLAVKGLREAVEKANDEWVLKNGSSVRREILESFDAKAKEILGESS